MVCVTDLGVRFGLTIHQKHTYENDCHQTLYSFGRAYGGSDRVLPAPDTG
jgi:hypothetical protein